MKSIKRSLVAAATFCILALFTFSARAEPVLWVIKGPHATVYLFGSVHILRPDRPWRSSKIDAAIKASDTLYLEIPDADDQAAMQPLIMQLGVDVQHPLSTKLTKDQLSQLDVVARKAAIPNGEATLEPLRPWLAAISLSEAPMVAAGFDPKSGVEFVLKPEFVKDNKPVLGLEDAAKQFHFFADLPQKQEVDYLNSTVSDFDHAPNNLKKLIDAWYAGDLKQLNDLLNGEFRTKYPDLYQLLIVQRNRSWIPQIQKLIEGTGTTFVAVGAGHLVGPDGVPALLEKAGIAVTRQ